MAPFQFWRTPCRSCAAERLAFGIFLTFEGSGISFFRFTGNLFKDQLADARHTGGHVDGKGTVVENFQGDDAVAGSAMDGWSCDVDP